jgi:hypothetical protein
MKNLFAFLILAIFTSCGGAPKENTDYKKIIGTPIKIENLEVAQYDFPFKMSWDEAYQASTAMGDGWRMPTVEELNTIFKNERRLKGFEKNRIYWSKSTDEINANLVWTAGFLVGDMRSKKETTNDLRVVRNN